MAITDAITDISFKQSIPAGNVNRAFTSIGVDFVNVDDAHIYIDGVEQLPSIAAFRKEIAISPGPVKIIFDTAPNNEGETDVELEIRYDTARIALSTDFSKSTSGTDANKEYYRILALIKTAILESENSRETSDTGLEDVEIDKTNHELIFTFSDGRKHVIDFDYLTANKFVQSAIWEPADNFLTLRYNDNTFATSVIIPLDETVDTARPLPFNNTKVYKSNEVFYWMHENVMYIFKVRDGLTFQASADAPSWATGNDIQYYVDTTQNPGSKIELIANLSNFASLKDLRLTNAVDANTGSNNLRLGVVYKDRLGEERIFNSEPIELPTGTGLTDEEEKHLAAVTDLVIRREVKFVGASYTALGIPTLATGQSGGIALKQQNPPRVRFIYGSGETLSSINAAFLGRTMTLTIDGEHSIALDVLEHKHTFVLGGGWHAEEYAISQHEHFPSSYDLNGKEVSVYLPAEGKADTSELEARLDAYDALPNTGRVKTEQLTFYHDPNQINGDASLPMYRIIQILQAGGTPANLYTQRQSGSFVSAANFNALTTEDLTVGGERHTAIVATIPGNFNDYTYLSVDYNDNNQELAKQVDIPVATIANGFDWVIPDARAESSANKRELRIRLRYNQSDDTTNILFHQEAIPSASDTSTEIYLFSAFFTRSTAKSATEVALDDYVTDEELEAKFEVDRQPDWLQYFDRYYVTPDGIDTDIAGAGDPVLARGATFANGLFTFTSTLGSSARLPDELSAKMAAASVVIFGTIANHTGSDLHPILFESGNDGRPLLTQWKGGLDYLNLYGEGPQLRLSANGTFPNNVDLGVGAIFRDTTATGWINGREQSTATVPWTWEADDRPTLGENNLTNTNGNFVGTQKQMIFLTSNAAYDRLSASEKVTAENAAAAWATTNSTTKVLTTTTNIDLNNLGAVYTPTETKKDVFISPAHFVPDTAESSRRYVAVKAGSTAGDLDVGTATPTPSEAGATEYLNINIAVPIADWDKCHKVAVTSSHATSVMMNSDAFIYKDEITSSVTQNHLASSDGRNSARVRVYENQNQLGSRSTTTHRLEITGTIGRVYIGRVRLVNLELS